MFEGLELSNRKKMTVKMDFKGILMGYRARRIDANQPAMVKFLRDRSISVAITASLGNGFPDLVIGLPNRITCLVEIKDGSKPPSARKLTPDEQAFHDGWQGEIAIVATLDELEALIDRLMTRV